MLVILLVLLCVEYTAVFGITLFCDPLGSSRGSQNLGQVSSVDVCSCSFAPPQSLLLLSPLLTALTSCSSRFTAIFSISHSEILHSPPVAFAFSCPLPCYLIHWSPKARTIRKLSFRICQSKKFPKVKQARKTSFKITAKRGDQNSICT